MGFADSPATINALASHGIRVSGFRWQWGLGLKGGTYPPHYHQNGDHEPTATSFEALPGEDLNGSDCMCALVPVYRDEAGRFARPGLKPVFQPPATASGGTMLQYDPRLVPEPIDWEPLTAAITSLREPPPVYVNVASPDVVIPDIQIPPYPAFPEFPTFDLQAPSVTVEAPQVTVNMPAVEEPPDRKSVYFAGISGKVTIPKTHVVTAITAVTETKSGSVKMGTGPPITVPEHTGWSDVFEYAPMEIKTVVFRNTAAYYVRAMEVL